MNFNFPTWFTAPITDACIREGVPLRVAPPAIVPLRPGMRFAGPVRPTRHAGSVDVFLEAMLTASPGDVLVIDNGGRTDEGCIGDLIVGEAQARGVAGIVCWGLHRDTDRLLALGLPVFSCGCLPCGPTEMRPRAVDALAAATIGTCEVSADDMVFADADGVVFVPRAHAERVLAIAAEIDRVERRQIELIAAGTGLIDQFRFRDYLTARDRDASTTFRVHLRTLGAAVEE